MPVRKTAIAIPQDLLEDVDRAAVERGESRSRYITRVLRFAVRARRDAEITRRLDALFASEAVKAEQRQGATEADDDDGWREGGW
jgi:metal-responsive CopG/Arc/MetJ family transcriptional regulator